MQRMVPQREAERRPERPESSADTQSTPHPQEKNWLSSLLVTSELTYDLDRSLASDRRNDHRLVAVDLEEFTCRK
jgi:hypothetical protein